MKKRFWFEQVIAFESGTSKSHNPEQDTCHWQSVSYETPLRFKISLRKIFLESGSLGVMKKMMKVLS